MSARSSGSVLLFQPHNEVEARGVELALADAGIPSIVVPRRDSAYPGITDRGQPWGELRVPSEQLEAAKSVLEQWREADVEDLEEAFDEFEPAREDASPTQPPAPWLAAVLSLVLPGLGQAYAREPLRAAAVLVVALLAGRFLDGLVLALVPMLAALDAARQAARKNRPPPPPLGEGPYRRAPADPPAGEHPK